MGRRQRAGEVIVQKPDSIWRRPLKSDVGELLKALVRGAAGGVMRDAAAVRDAFIDAGAAVGLADRGAGALTWVLVRNALASAIALLASERSGVTGLLIEKFVERLDALLEQSQWKLTTDFLEHPENLPLLREVERLLYETLRDGGVPSPNADLIANSLPAYFIEALFAEWHARPGVYAQIEEHFQGKFRRSLDIDLAWRAYETFLDRQLDSPVFDEPFGLRHIFIPLRGIRRDLDVVCDVEADLREWVQSTPAQDALRIVSGGPGSGKSSLARVIAARLARERRVRVVYIPLYLFDFTDRLETAVHEFAEHYDVLPREPLTSKRDRRLVIIFDGVDELTLQGDAGAETARKFFVELRKMLGRMNLHESSPVGARTVCIVTGREILLQGLEHVINPRHIIELLPFSPIGEAALRDATDPRNFAAVDQRDVWWRRYGELKGLGYDCMPEQLAVPGLDDVTSQPLLNYLVSLSFHRGTLDFTHPQSIHAIYRDLIGAVYDRTWATGQHPSIAAVSREDFETVLGEIGVCTWHGGSRTTTVRAVEERCRAAGLAETFRSFEEAARKSIVNLLAAFYFRFASKNPGGERTFEFTHKTFGEYLIAYRIGRAVFDLLDQGEQAGLPGWYALCGPVALDAYLLQFLRDEIASWNDGSRVPWPQALEPLFSKVVSHGAVTPMTARMPPAAERMTMRNAEEVLLAVLSGVAGLARTQVRPTFRQPSDFGDWLARAVGQRSASARPLVLECLAWLDLSEAHLANRDFMGANLSHSSFTKADLSRSLFESALANEASFAEANLTGANFREANLYNARFTGATLLDTSFRASKMSGATAPKTTWQNVDFRGARLTEAVLEESTFLGCDFTEANLVDASLSNATFEGCRLTKAKFDGADLTKTTFRLVTATGATFIGATFDETVVQPYSIDHASLTPEQRSGLAAPNEWTRANTADYD